MPRGIFRILALTLPIAACSSSSSGAAPDDASTHPEDASTHTDDAGVVAADRDGATDAEQDDASVMACASPADSHPWFHLSRLSGI